MVNFAAVCTLFKIDGQGSNWSTRWNADEVADERYETVIGLEVHAQLLTKSKMYCGCSARYADAPPNTLVCMVCGGFPGALPALNEAAIEAAILTGVALNCAIPPFCKLDRKNYFYPDLPKGYQISQYDLPLAVDGHLEFVAGASRGGPASPASTSRRTPAGSSTAPMTMASRSASSISTGPACH